MIKTGRLATNYTGAVKEDEDTDGRYDVVSYDIAQPKYSARVRVRDGNRKNNTGTPVPSKPPGGGLSLRKLSANASDMFVYCTNARLLQYVLAFTFSKQRSISTTSGKSRKIFLSPYRNEQETALSLPQERV